jgi:acetyl esterase/lipase
MTANCLLRLIAIFIAAAIAPAGHVRADDPLRLWPATPPGDEGLTLPAEADTSGPDSGRVAGESVIRLGNVSTPTLEIYRPDPAIASGTAVIICPGGGHSILAYDLEGTEVALWLREIGVTAVVLKYRVPARPDVPRHQAAVQDAQRAVSLVRSQAQQWSLDPEKIGILGFSAGGQTAALTALNGTRTYAPIDAVDEVPCRPNFAVLIYPAYLVDRDNPTQLVAEATVDANSPPMFLVHAWDDGVTPQSSIQLASALKQQGVACDLHLFDRGGHGYGMRPTELPVTHWPRLCEQWLRTSGWLSTTAQQAAEQAIRKLIMDQQAAWNRGDIDGFMSAYWESEALTFSSGADVTRGFAATKERYHQRYPTPERMGETQFTDLEIRLQDAESALVLGNWALKRQPDAIGGNFTLVLRRIDGAWKIVHDHTSKRD